MKYENRTIPEGINVTDEHPLKEFFILTTGIGLATVLVVFLLSMAAGWLVQFIPFSVEQKLAQSAFSAEQQAIDANTDDEHQHIESYLQQLAEQLIAVQNLPEDMTITVHYADTSTVNAFATLGGHIIMHRGLVEKLPNENTLSMLLAHEIAHIKHRDPIVSLGRGVTVALALASLSGFGDSGISQQLVGNLSMLTSLSFSREQEQQADLEALKTLENYYGHVNGAAALFEILQQNHQGTNPPKLLSTHPVTAERIREAKAYHSSLNSRGEIRNLPEILLSLGKSSTQPDNNSGQSGE